MPQPMTCLVCTTDMESAFHKDVPWEDLGRVEYVRCPSCGFVASATHAVMADDRWAAINEAFHHGGRAQEGAGRSTEARWRERLNGYDAALRAAADAGLVSTTAPWLDYACGDGALAELVEAWRAPIDRHEPFGAPDDPRWLDRDDLRRDHYDVVINTAMFEHVRDRSSLDHLVSLVAPDGALALHTVVVETVPADPGWFYLQPVHCAFFTNESMRRLCREWGFVAGAYHIDDRLWILRRRPWTDADATARLEALGWVLDDGFVAYWT